MEVSFGPLEPNLSIVAVVTFGPIGQESTVQRGSQLAGEPDSAGFQEHSDCEL